jgi:hypothetical protein
MEEPPRINPISLKAALSSGRGGVFVSAVILLIVASAALGTFEGGFGWFWRTFSAGLALAGLTCGLSEPVRRWACQRWPNQRWPSPFSFFLRFSAVVVAIVFLVSAGI